MKEEHCFTLSAKLSKISSNNFQITSKISAQLTLWKSQFTEDITSDYAVGSEWSAVNLVTRKAFFFYPARVKEVHYTPNEIRYPRNDTQWWYEFSVILFWLKPLDCLFQFFIRRHVTRKCTEHRTKKVIYANVICLKPLYCLFCSIALLPLTTTVSHLGLLITSLPLTLSALNNKWH